MTWDYNRLKAEVTKFAMRGGDTEYEDTVPTFISLGESALNRELPLRVMEVDAPLTGTTGSRFIPLPADFVEPFALHLTTYGEPRCVRPGVAGQMEVRSSNSEPTEWAINGTNIELNAPCDQNHSFIFRYRKSFALSDAEPTNWLLTHYPDAYLAAALVWGGVFMRDTAEAAPWKAILDDAIAKIGWLEARSIAVAPLTADPALAGRGGFNIYTG